MEHTTSKVWDGELFSLLVRSDFDDGQEPFPTSNRGNPRSWILEIRGGCTVAALRRFVNTTLMDGLYYKSPEAWLASRALYAAVAHPQLRYVETGEMPKWAGLLFGVDPDES